jgi:uncharacterized protein (DUF1697 family)
VKTYIALLRGINVGGKDIVPMRELVETLEALGLNQVRTYIQSGNVVFQSARSDLTKLTQDIRAAIGNQYGFTPELLLFDLQTFQAAITDNPFPEAEREPKTLHLFFLARVPENPNLAALDRIRKENERFELVNNVFYLHAPDGIGRSKLAQNVGKDWDVAVTARNWRTVSKIMAMVEEVA